MPKKDRPLPISRWDKLAGWGDRNPVKAIIIAWLIGSLIFVGPLLLLCYLSGGSQ